MSGLGAKCGLTALQWSLGVVVLIEAVMFVLQGQRMISRACTCPPSCG